MSVLAQILVIEGLLVHLIILYFVIHFFRLRYKYPSFRPYSNTFTILSLGILLLNIGASTTKLDNVFPNFPLLNLPELIIEPFIYLSAYTSFIGLWILGHHYLINNVVKIPDQRRSQFFISQRLLYFLLIFLVLMIPTALGILLPNLFGRDHNTIVEAIFVLISQISLLAFLFFRRALLKEKEMNISKLTQARLELIASSAKYQVAISMAIFFGALTGFFLPYEYDINIEMFMFNFIHIFSILSCIKFYQAFHLPKKIRLKYGLTENRYKEFSKRLSD